jgi:hypothetical protein
MIVVSLDHGITITAGPADGGRWNAAVKVRPHARSCRSRIAPSVSSLIGADQLS